jgi:hypothetical protein
MGRRLHKDESEFFERRTALLNVGHALRKGFESGLIAPQDPDMENLVKILSETSPHKMGSC